MVFRLSDDAFLAFWASCGSVWFIWAAGVGCASFPTSTTSEKLPPLNECICDKCDMNFRSKTVSRVLPKTRRATGPVDALTESLHALPLEKLDGSLEGWFVAALSHPAFCSPREPTARAALLSEHALDVVGGLTVRMRRG